MKWIKVFFKTALTALLVFVLIFAGGWLLAQSRQQYRYANRLEQLRDVTRPYQAPKYFIELQPNRQLANRNTNTDVKDIINNVPSLNKLAITEKHTPLSLHPKISKRYGNRWKNYAKPFEATRDSNKVAIIIANSGLDVSLFEAAAESLPDNIAFSFSPYTDNLQQKINFARTNGHETYADIRLPETDLSVRHHGPAATASENSEQYLKNLLSSQTAVGGIVLRGDSQYAAPLIKQAIQKKLLIVGSDTAFPIPAPFASYKAILNAGITIENGFYPEEIQAEIEMAEQLASTKGHILIIAEPKPVVLLALADWIGRFDEKNNLELVPPTALIEEY